MGVDQLYSLRKIRTRLRGMNFYINCTSLAHFAPSFMQKQNGPKCTQTLQKHNKRWVSGPMGWIRCVHCENIPHNFAARTYALIAPVWPILHWVYCRNKNNPKCTQTLRNATKDEFRVQWGGLGVFVVKIPTRLRGTNFCINWTSSALFAPSFMQ